MSVFIHSDYRLALNYTIDRYRRQKPTFNQSRLAEKTGIHNTFISNVLKGRSDFNPDQIYAIGEALDLSQVEIDFTVMLLEHEKATNSKRKEKLSQHIHELRQKNLKLGTQLQLQEPDFSKSDEIEYYLNPYYMILHTAFHLPRYASSLETLATRLRLSVDYVRGIARRLEEMQFVSYDEKKKRYVVQVESRHLSKESALCIPHQTILRNQGLRHMGEIASDRRNFFSATFLGGEKLRAEIEKEFYKFTKRVKKLADASGEQTGVYQMNFDLFPWD